MLYIYETRFLDGDIASLLLVLTQIHKIVYISSITKKNCKILHPFKGHTPSGAVTHHHANVKQKKKWKKKKYKSLVPLLSLKSSPN